jgi:hypothetical protein
MKLCSRAENESYTGIGDETCTGAGTEEVFPPQVMGPAEGAAEVRDCQGGGTRGYGAGNVTGTGA